MERLQAVKKSPNTHAIANRPAGGCGDPPIYGKLPIWTETFENPGACHAGVRNGLQ